MCERFKRKNENIVKDVDTVSSVAFSKLLTAQTTVIAADGVVPSLAVGS
jgi:hypothetical protein